MPPETVLEMATINGAKSLLWDDEIGSLEVGKRADVAIFDMQKPEWQPVHNPIANLVFASRGGADTVICDGRVLMEKGVVTAIDERRALGEAVRKRFGIDLNQPRKLSELTRAEGLDGESAAVYRDLALAAAEIALAPDL